MAEKTKIKEHIAAMKVKRDDAIARQAHDELKQIRRGIRTLKRRIRVLAKAAKAQPVQAEAPQAAPVEAPAPTETAEAPAEAAATEAPAEAAEETPTQE